MFYEILFSSKSLCIFNFGINRYFIVSCGQKSLRPLFPQIIFNNYRTFYQGYTAIFKSVSAFRHSSHFLPSSLPLFVLPFIFLFSYSLWTFLNIPLCMHLYFTSLCNYFFSLFLSSFLWPIIQLLTITMKPLLPKFSPWYKNLLKLLRVHRPPFRALRGKLQGQGRWANPFLYSPCQWHCDAQLLRCSQGPCFLAFMPTCHLFPLR